MIKLNTTFRNDRILITGCGGMLGQSVYEAFSALCPYVKATDIDLNEPWLTYLDVRDAHACKEMFDDFNPTIVLHLAALTDLEYCEKNPTASWDTNAEGTKNIALLTEQFAATMVYISTAGVFDGTKNFYTELDQPRPINVYGASKYYGEEFIPLHVTKYFIFRAGWMMGGGIKKDKKFINKIFKQLWEGTENLYVVNDKSGAPTYTKDFASSIVMMLGTERYGLYNQVCGGSATRLEIAREFLRLLGYEHLIKVHEVTSEYFKNDFFAPRPASETLVNMKLNDLKLNIMRPWHICLAEYSEVYKQALANRIPRYKQ